MGGVVAALQHRRDTGAVHLRFGQLAGAGRWGLGRRRHRRRRDVHLRHGDVESAAHRERGRPDIGPFVFGTPGATYPVVGDWDGDGDDAVAGKQTAGPTWSLRNSNSAGRARQDVDFGLANDLPLSRRTG
jgi:hypothetical protein